MSPARTDDTPATAGERAVGWWRAVVERSSDLVLAYEADGLIAYASPSIEQVLGWSAPDLVGTDGMHVIDGTHRGRVADALGRMLRNDSASEQVFPVRHRDGGWRFLEARATNHLDDPEIAAVLVSLRDVTDRISAENALAERDHLYRNIVEATPDPVLIVRGRVVVHANPAATQLFGPGDGTAVPEREVGPLFEPALTPHADDTIWAAGSEHRVLRADGHSRHVEVTAIPTTWDGEPATQLVVHDVTDRRLHDMALRHQATHDPLTGLPNRSLLADRLEHASSRAQRTRRPFAVLFVDLDRFKVVNDTLGHEVGDELLRQIATRLGDAVRPGDTVARLGGDEFVVVVEDLLVNDTIDLVVERIQEGLREPFAINGRDFLINASIGVLVTSDGGDPKSLLRDADAAMYTAKTRGRGQAVRFDAALRERASRYEDTQRRLRAAVEERQVTVAFQPIVRLSDRRVLAAEALMRWEHPERGTLLPDAFLDVADDAGLLSELGAQVVDLACVQLARWRQTRTAGDGGRGLTASINVAHSELLTPGFAGSVLDTLRRHQLPAPALCVEVSESSLLDEPVRATEALRPLREVGVALAIDDFGTGYTSLAALRRFSPDVVKIDRAFVNGMTDTPGDAALVRAAIQMGHALGIKVIAEGVELAEQQHLLGLLGCDMAQGFLFGRPVRAEQFPLPAADPH